MRKRLVILGALALALSPLSGVFGQIEVPMTVNYQGTLYNALVGTRESGLKDLEFRLYVAKDAEAAAAVWGETHTGVALFEGVFNVVLGTGEAIDGIPHPSLDEVFTGAAIWLGVAVVGETGERQERQPFASAPYALTANTAVTATHGVPAGMVAPWVGDIAAVPEGWLPCDGRTLDATAESGKYAALWQAIGTTWGGTGETDFKVPNLGGRALMGDMASGAGRNQNTDASSAGLTAHTLGDLLGEESHVLTLDEMPGHYHDYQDRHYGATWENTDLNDGWDLDNVMQYESRATLNTLDQNDTVVHAGNTGSAAAHQNMQPSVVVGFMIKY
jgi:microcystin-dependent protein